MYVVTFYVNKRFYSDFLSINYLHTLKISPHGPIPTGKQIEHVAGRNCETANSLIHFPLFISPIATSVAFCLLIIQIYTNYFLVKCRHNSGNRWLVIVPYTHYFPVRITNLKGFWLLFISSAIKYQMSFSDLWVCIRSFLKLYFL